MHKTQALSIKHLVRGCLEGVFAQGQVYVLTVDGLDVATPWARAGNRPALRLVPWLRRALSVSRISRVTDPRNLTLVGLPPKDLLVEVMAGWQATGYDGIECLRNACSVSKDFLYVPDPSLPILDRVQVRRKQEKLIKTSWRNFKEILNPQHNAQIVIHKFLD